MPNIPGLEVTQTPLVISSPVVLLVEGKDESKATVQAFLSGMPETIASLGRAAQKHYWPFDDGALMICAAF